MRGVRTDADDDMEGLVEAPRIPAEVLDLFGVEAYMEERSVAWKR